MLRLAKIRRKEFLRITGGNMPAYGKNLSPAETTALVAFLETLRPAGQPAARDASHSVALEPDVGGRPLTQP
jgi:mono/diheme cytochrome c family protein